MVPKNGTIDSPGHTSTSHSKNILRRFRPQSSNSQVSFLSLPSSLRSIGIGEGVFAVVEDGLLSSSLVIQANCDFAKKFFNSLCTCEEASVKLDLETLVLDSPGHQCRFLSPRNGYSAFDPMYTRDPRQEIDTQTIE